MSLMKKGVRFATAYKRWLTAGKPQRSEEDIAKLYAICEQCDDFNPPAKKGRSGSCKLCGCRLNIGGRINKLQMATEGCPAEKPKWLADVNGELISEPPPPHPQKEKERRQRRKRRRRGREAPPLAKLPTNTDPLDMIDRYSQPMQHALRDMWALTSGFLVGGGPSLQSLDLSPLKERGIVSLGINNVAAYAPVRAFVCADPPEKFHHGIWFDGGMMKFVPRKKLGKRVRAKKADGSFAFTTLRVQDCPQVFGFHRDSHWNPEEFFTRPHATWGRGKSQSKEDGKPHILFTFFVGLRLMHYFGCRRVYLLGVDFGMDSSHGYVFGQARNEGAIRGNNNSYRIAREMCEELSPVFKSSGFEVYNCNEHSRLTTFPFVPFEKAIEDCRGLVPKEPLDLVGWYDKNGDDDRGDENE